MRISVQKTFGDRDFTRVIGEAVAMEMDNDCTAATAGSLVGAIVGKQGIPEHWYRGFQDTVHSYLIGKPKFSPSVIYWDASLHRQSVSMGYS